MRSNPSEVPLTLFRLLLSSSMVIDSSMRHASLSDVPSLIKVPEYFDVLNEVLKLSSDAYLAHSLPKWFEIRIGSTREIFYVRMAFMDGEDCF
ncbi:hypothetical protein EVAR_73632_1 [Eumeta japonica]|uniref:Uncharacterized protein n=1 Tax=Eumeta variegata TaxID=151549 RepID=A0A4C1SZ18_EUMVA|nr:hypothetical protein EVAR_73632_1 [Eumeta japonica]